MPPEDNAHPSAAPAMPPAGGPPQGGLPPTGNVTLTLPMPLFQALCQVIKQGADAAMGQGQPPAAGAPPAEAPPEEGGGDETASFFKGLADEGNNKSNAR